MEEISVLLSQLKAGMNLPEVKRKVTQETINLYAKASGDFNPIHIDEDFAKKAGLGGTIAHGMLILAYISQMMTAAFGKYWLDNGKLQVRFRNPARVGDTITVSGRITKIGAGETETLVSCDILCQNQKGEAVITGEASVGMKKSENNG